MFDTTIAIVGNALTLPEYRRLERTQALVAHFKVASTSRRFDRGSNRWIDGDSLRVRVTCWRRLAEGVVSSIKVGDPVIVTGRLYTREWTTDDGQRRVTYELDAFAVGHDLARGVGVFKRGRPSLSTSTVEDAETDAHVRGEPTEAVPELSAQRTASPNEVDEDGFFTAPHDGYDHPDELPGGDPSEFGSTGRYHDLGSVLSAGRDLDRPAPGGQESGQHGWGEAGPEQQPSGEPEPADRVLADSGSIDPEPADRVRGSVPTDPSAATAGSSDVARGRRGRSRVAAGV